MGRCECSEAADVDVVAMGRSLTVVPVLLGDGKPLFHRIATSTPLRLIDAQSFASGMVQLRYERA